jgi:hypothetical protein
VNDDYARRIARRTWISFLIVEAGAVVITLCALSDVLLGLGWGYDWKAVLIGLGICFWAALVWLGCRMIFRLFGVRDLSN